MRLIIEITMDDDAFAPDPVPEAVRILSTISRKLLDVTDAARLHSQAEPDAEAEFSEPLLDVNGNTVGSIKAVTQ